MLAHPGRARCSTRRRSRASRSTRRSRRRSPNSTGGDAAQRPRRASRARPRARDQVPRRFIFRHPLVRRTVYESIGGGSRLAAHGRAATALAARGAARPSAPTTSSRRPDRGDAEAIEVLLEAAAHAAARAPGGGGRWLEAALRLLPDGDRAPGRGPDRARLGLRSIGELERCRETLLETIEARWPMTTRRRVELTTWCAAVEHWLGRHEAAHARLFAPGMSSTTAAAPRDRRCRSSSRSTASTRWISSGRSRWAPKRSRARARSATAR